MRFWDASALVPLLVEEPSTAIVGREYKHDPAIIVWWGSAVECASAIARLERDGDLPALSVEDAFARLQALIHSWHEIQPAAEVRESAIRFLRVHDLRAADALQLAGAYVAAERRPSTLDFVCLDERLARAARREGFRVQAF